MHPIDLDAGVLRHVVGLDFAGIDHERPVHQVSPLRRPQRRVDSDDRARILKRREERFAFLSKTIDERVRRPAGWKAVNPTHPTQFSCHVASERPPVEFWYTPRRSRRRRHVGHWLLLFCKLTAPGAHAVFPPLKICFAVCSIEVSNLAWRLR